MKYKSSITNHSKVMANVKDFWRQTDKQTDGKNICPQSIDMGGIQSVSEDCQNEYPMCKVLMYLV